VWTARTGQNVGGAECGRTRAGEANGGGGGARPARSGRRRSWRRRRPRPACSTTRAGSWRPTGPWSCCSGWGRRAAVRPHPGLAGLPARRGAGPGGRPAGAGRGAGPLPGGRPLGADLLPGAGLGRLRPLAGPRPARPPRAGHRHGPRPDRDEALRARAPLLRVHVQADRRGRLQPRGADRRRPDHLPLHPLRHGPGVAARRQRPGLQPVLVLQRLRIREAARGQRGDRLPARRGPARARLGQAPAAAAGGHPPVGSVRSGRGRPAGRGSGRPWPCP
jgi:hypothetical protein